MDIKRGYTYNDVLLVPKKFNLQSRRDIDVSTNITRNIKLNIPMISLCMATVTESNMAIAMAREGGIGIIHRFMPIEEQANEIKKVKRSTSNIVQDPVTVSSDKLLKDAIEINKIHNVTGLLVTDSENKLVGMLTQRDFVFEENTNVPIVSLMTPREKLIVAEPNISIKEAKHLLTKHGIEKLPLVDSDNYIKGLVTIQDIKHLEEYKNACRDEKGRLRVAAAIGIKPGFLERAELLIKSGVDILVLDVAHAHTEPTLNAIKQIKSKFSIDLLAGNVATSQATEELIRAGVDGVKVGIGNGTICTTRVNTGAGVPQFTAMLEAVKIGKEYNIPIINDGGITTSGNFAKAIAVGASAVMFGSAFAGTHETPGPIVYRNGKQFKHYHGSTSYMSNVINQSRNDKEKVKEYLRDAFVEGVESMVPYKGPVSEVIHTYLKGLRSGMSYSGASNIKEMHSNSEFIEITSSGFAESNPHGIDEV
jgi:IMP dehydrogenase